MYWGIKAHKQYRPEHWRTFADAERAVEAAAAHYYGIPIEELRIVTEGETNERND